MDQSIFFTTKGDRLAFFSMLAFYCTLFSLGLSALNFFLLDPYHPLLIDEERYQFIALPLLFSFLYFTLCILFGKPHPSSTLILITTSATLSLFMIPSLLAVTTLSEKAVLFSQMVFLLFTMTLFHKALGYSISHRPAHAFLQDTKEQNWDGNLLESFLKQTAQQVSFMQTAPSDSPIASAIFHYFLSQKTIINSMEIQTPLGYWIFLDTASAEPFPQNVKAQEETEQNIMQEPASESQDEPLPSSEDSTFAQEQPVAIPFYITIRPGFNPLRWLILPYLKSPAQVYDNLQLPANIIKG